MQNNCLKVNKLHQLHILKMTPSMRDKVLKPMYAQWPNMKSVTIETYQYHWWITYQRDKIKINYLNKLMRSLSGNGKIGRILNKICNGRKTSA